MKQGTAKIPKTGEKKDQVQVQGGDKGQVLACSRKCLGRQLDGLRKAGSTALQMSSQPEGAGTLRPPETGPQRLGHHLFRPGQVAGLEVQGGSGGQSFCPSVTVLDRG